AVEVQERFLRQFPKSNYRKDMILQVAKTYELLANYEKAGGYFLEFCNLYPTDKQSKDALRLAGLYLGGSGNTDRAVAAMSEYMKRYPNDTKTVEEDLIRLYENLGNTQ